MKKAALITGASSGIGQATALEFARNGYFIYLMGRNRERLEETALQCTSGAAILACDLKDPAQVEKRVKEATENPLFRLEVLVNNAGVFHTHSMEEGTDEIWTEQFQANLLGPVRLTRLLIPYFKKHEKGSIVNIASTLGLRPSSNTGAYSALKAALINWTQSLAQETGAFGVRANCVCPGLVDTPIHSFNALPALQKEEVLKQMSSLQPLGRIGTPQDLAKSIYFIGSDQSSWTTGAVLAVDGGINLQ
ncbi:SDR family NAD(P)-dependent oxidoreductase [Bdellovibrio sp. HCB337]|uniref:SDR family NAD(P)-dependent oxidoreductase n=1 Tax=Bdellovibrio sp. HCB337 TaxID=3394358 RepID=UPI0039A4BA58